ncbi:MAG: tRNA lysidine(34) synthetase TilS [Lachnospiraceae bacterium]|nr:tRNA lysidine(34) synthetase TilS [Lachnospiraceae bacterium]
MNTQKLLSYLRQCIKQYNMIKHGDKIAVGLSGGKDSLTLLYGLKQLQAFYPESFELAAIHVNLGIETDSAATISIMEDFCKKLNVPFYCVDTDIFQVVFKERKEKNPCSLCAKMRKGALNEKALALGCNKIAYAHHKDDFIETSMMSLLFEGHYYCFPPVTFLNKTGLTLIRPMMYMEEKEIKGFAYKNDFPVINNACPADGNTKRQVIKDFIAESSQKFPYMKKNLNAAILNYFEETTS